MILIVTHKQDYTVDFVIKKLNSKNVKYLRYNTEDLIINNDICINLKDNEFKIKIGEHNKFKSIWFRRVKIPDCIKYDEIIQPYIENELNSFFHNLWEILDSKWLSVPHFIYKAENKLFQLKEASNLGFIIPNTLVTSNPKLIKDFYYENEKNIVVKPLTSIYFFDKDKHYLIYTNKLKEEYINKIEKYIPLPNIFQKYISKDIEIRVTVVGNKCFSASVDSQISEKTKVDWRKDKLIFTKYDLPKDIEKKCINLVKKLNLSFGAIDLIKDQEGNFVFLEINPNGQWAWIEMDTMLPISDEIINFLTI